MCSLSSLVLPLLLLEIHSGVVFVHIAVWSPFCCLAIYQAPVDIEVAARLFPDAAQLHPELA
jgi:hypothetical protein